MSNIQPPVPPRIPQNNVQSLIPRLTTTINDIDQFRTLLASGSQDGTMPNWDVTLQRYSVLLGRITALSEYISAPPSSTLPSSSSFTNPTQTRPNLQQYLTHPLNPLPDDPSVSPYAADVYFQVLNTLPIPQLSEAQNTLLSPGLGWSDKFQLSRMSDEELNALSRRLEGRLTRERERGKGLRAEIESRAGEVDWGMRVDEEEEGEDGSLFGDDDEDDNGGGDGEEGKEEEEKVEVLPNPREGWTIQDYVRFMETGKPPGQ